MGGSPRIGKAQTAGTVRVGIGGWTYAPWRGVFYPPGLSHGKELAYASSHLTSIEINGTFYRSQTPATFSKWANQTPDDFVFAVKGPRFVTHRRVLADAGEAIARFLRSGVAELGGKLGPLLWQFAPSKRFEPADFAAFLSLLPRTLDGRPLRHAVEVRHDSFCTPAFIDLVRDHAIPVVYADHARYPAIPDITGDFLYCRLQQGQDHIPTGYPPAALDGWALRLRAWARGKYPDDLPWISAARPPPSSGRDVFAYFIHGGKMRAPAAAAAVIERLRR